MPEPFDEVPAEVEREVIADSVEIYANAHDCHYRSWWAGGRWRSAGDPLAVGTALFGWAARFAFA
jgi:hypothetical protein